MVSAAHFSFMGTCRNTTFEVLYYNLFSGISRWYHYHAYSARTAHPFQRNGAPFCFRLSKAQQVY